MGDLVEEARHAAGRAAMARAACPVPRSPTQHPALLRSPLLLQPSPLSRRVLPKEQFASFFDRLMEDTARRMANRAEIAERARQEALAKLAGKGGSGSSSPAPCRRPASART